MGQATSLEEDPGPGRPRGEVAPCTQHLKGKGRREPAGLSSGPFAIPMRLHGTQQIICLFPVWGRWGEGHWPELPEVTAASGHLHSWEES